MKTIIAVSIVVLAAGCNVCEPKGFRRPAPTGAPWDQSYLIDLDPAAVSDADLATIVARCEDFFWQYSQVDGCTWQPTRSSPDVPAPDGYGSGGDTCLFSGISTAGFAFKYAALKDEATLLRLVECVRGLYLLTHATGTPGVICRASFPTERAAEWGYPQTWGGRDAEYVGTRADVDDPVRGGVFPSQTYYTRGTKDQLTGLVYGLCAVWALVPEDGLGAELRWLAASITEDVYTHLVRYDWRIRNQRGKNDTSADDVDDLLKIQLLALYRRTVTITNPDAAAEVEAAYQEEFKRFVGIIGILEQADRYNNLQQYYAYNLRACRSHAIWMLEDNPERKQVMSDYFEKHIWRYTRGHQNAWLAALRSAIAGGDAEADAEAVYALKSLSLRPLRLWSSPYHDQEEKPGFWAVTFNCTANFAVPPHLRRPNAYFTWQKEPWDVGEGLDTQGIWDRTGADMFVPYWVRRYYLR